MNVRVSGAPFLVDSQQCANCLYLLSFIFMSFHHKDNLGYEDFLSLNALFDLARYLVS